ncbi:MAG: MBL fold metallo-hydrolase [Anaerotruncus sp.]|nr:MAG: MBL fold metallo-hydrolase [Anaerotruncus sp.]
MLSSGKASLAAFCGINQQNTSADILVAEGSEIMLGETKISVIATPGHTKGGVCYLADDCIFTGDTLFFSARADARIFPGGSAKEIMQSLKRLSALDSDLKVYPGHDRFFNNRL